MRRRVHPFLLSSLLGRRFGRPLLAVLIGVPLAIACGQEAVSIPDPDAPDSGGGTEAGKDGDITSEGGSDGGTDAADVTCADVLPDDTTGIYVTPTGTNNGTCGTRTSPCKTITFSVARAGVALRSKVYAARGTYSEKVTLAAGVEVVGGWDVTGATWKRACVSPEDAVVLRAPAGQSITVEARDLGGEARLSLLKVESKAQAQLTPGESIYGVVAVGATTTLVLENVSIEMGNAPDGAVGSKGDAGTPAPASCAAGTGLPGTNGATGTGAPPGSYDPANEYTPGIATGGAAGAAGGDGTAGGTGSCVTCGVCTAAPACVFIEAQNQPTCGKDGTPGCAGGPGGPGFPATGGGTNIALFAWDANVTVNGGKIKSGNAGNGGAGGAPGTAGASTNGAVGGNADICVTACAAPAMVGGACVETKGRGLGGTAGGKGGAAGLGGPGGGGGGGSSFAIYQGGAGLVTTTPSTTLAHGTAGKGGAPDGGAGAPGSAANRLP